jgi:exonuclease III
MSSSLKIVPWNASGILKKINELSALLSKINVDIILINETHLKKFSRSQTIYRNDLILPNNPAHGTTILIRHNIVHQPVTLKTKLIFINPKLNK